MRSTLALVLLMGLSAATATDFTTVYEWDKLEASPSGGVAWPQDINPRYLAVFRDRIFLSMELHEDIPATLFSIPTASAAPPKLTPFPSLENHRQRNCSNIQYAKGLEVDSLGRLWVMDSGNRICPPKLWIFDLAKNDQLVLVHDFPGTSVTSPDQGTPLELVIDETGDDWLAFILDNFALKLYAFSLKTRQSWPLDLEGALISGIALSPDKQLFLRQSYTSDVFSAPVQRLRTGHRTLDFSSVGSLSARPYRMLMDSNGSLHAAFSEKNYTATWKKSGRWYDEHRLFEAETQGTHWPFAFAIDRCGTLWMSVLNQSGKPRHKLVKGSIGASSYVYGTSRVGSDGTCSPTRKSV